MVYCVRKKINRNENKEEYKEIGELDIVPPALGQEIKINNKKYIINTIILGYKNILNVI